MSKKFIELCLSGEALSNEVDDYIDKWHKNTNGMSLVDFLGFSQVEHLAFLKDDRNINIIIAARRNNVSFNDLLSREMDAPRIAARLGIKGGDFKAVIKRLRSEYDI